MWQKLVTNLYKGSLEYYINWREHLRELTIALVVVLVIRSMVGVVYRIPTGSMIPTLIEEDILIANRFYYGLKLPFTEGVPGYKLPALRDVEAGDLIIFRAPREAVFVDVRLFYQGEDGDATTLRERELLNVLNEAAATRKRPVSLRDQEVNLEWMRGEKNYIFLDPSGRSVTLHLPLEVYSQYEEDITETFGIGVVATAKQRSILTFSDTISESWPTILLRPVWTSGRVLATALINSPFFLPYRYAALLFIETEEVVRGAFLMRELKLYPNDSSALYREYVKRVVALEGDRVELRGKRLYINEKLVPWSEAEGYSTRGSEEYQYYNEMMDYSLKSNPQDGTFSHPLRITEYEISPFAIFEDMPWPMDTSSPYAAGFRDYFGPVVVPADHYFVLGDNRDESLDSRYIGFVPKWEIKGVPMYIFFPGDRRGKIR